MSLQTAMQVRRQKQSTPSLANGLLQRTCEVCKKKPNGNRLLRAAAKSSPVMEVPPIVHEVLRSPGQPLDTETRAFMEPRFGHDFSRVRVHTDAKAAESARAVNARAYTVGHDVIFSSGKYNPTTLGGRRLLAHELTHVVQQQAGLDAIHLAGPEHAAEQEAEKNAKMVVSGKQIRAFERPPILARETEVTVQVDPNSCSMDQHRQIFPAVRQAQRWLNSSISELDSFLRAPAAPGLQAARNALNRHFHSTAISTTSQVRGRLNAIRTDLENRTTLNVECHSAGDRSCQDAGAHVIGSQLVFCSSFFEGSARWQTLTVIHEMAHALVGGPHITDRAYQSDRLYADLTTAQALTNAESFGLFARELGTGRAQISTAPQDEFEDCPQDWRPLLRRSIALAQRWNRNAQTALGDRRPVWLSYWTDLQTRYLGATTAASLDSAKGVVDKVARKLRNVVEFECEPGGGGRCDRYATYWYGIWSDFHICPSWKNQTTETARTESLLAGLYGYLGDLGDAESARRLNLARLARDLHSRFWR